MNCVTNGAFLAALRSSRLLTNEQLAEAEQILARGSGASELSREFVRRRMLTTWQLGHLESGHTQFRCGQYLLLDVLGQGNMGIVYKARRVDSPRLVAIKVMSGRAAANGRLSARFQREIRLVSTVRSPHVVRALDSGRIADRDYLVMEFVRGRTLDWWIQANRPLPITWACECARQVALGLQHVHESGLIHRDIKPSNIMVSGESVDRGPRVRILDLGLGRFAGPSARGDDLTRDGQTVGTLDYMAPEQLQDNRTVDIRSDIYALGCTLFEALTGRQPFEGKDLGEKMLAKLVGTPSRLEKFRNDVPSELAKLLLQMLCREPEGRPTIPKYVADALRGFATRRPAKPAKPNQSVGVAARSRLENVKSLTSVAGPAQRPAENLAKPPKSRFFRLLQWVRLVRRRTLRTSE